MDRPIGHLKHQWKARFMYLVAAFDSLPELNR